MVIVPSLVATYSRIFHVFTRATTSATSPSTFNDNSVIFSSRGRGYGRDHCRDSERGRSVRDLCGDRGSCQYNHCGRQNHTSDR